MSVSEGNEGLAAAEGNGPAIRSIRPDQPWRWLEAGWADMRRVPGISLTYGLVFLCASLSLVVAMMLAGLSALVPVMAAGFLLVGPMLAVGLYEASRRLEAGLHVRKGARVLGLAPPRPGDDGGLRPLGDCFLPFPPMYYFFHIK